MKKNCDEQISPALYSHIAEKRKHSNRRYKSRVVSNYRKNRIKNGEHSTYYLVKEKPVYTVHYVVEPAHTVEEKSFYIIKNGQYEYTDKKGVAHYSDKYVWKPTGRILYVPERKRKRSIWIGTVAVTPYLKRYSHSKNKQFAKRRTSRIARHNIKINKNDIGEDYNRTRSGYQKYFDYFY